MRMIGDRGASASASASARGRGVIWLGGAREEALAGRQSKRRRGRGGGRRGGRFVNIVGGSLTLFLDLHCVVKPEDFELTNKWAILGFYIGEIRIGTG